MKSIASVQTISFVAVVDSVLTGVENVTADMTATTVQTNKAVHQHRSCMSLFRQRNCAFVKEWMLISYALLRVSRHLPSLFGLASLRDYPSKQEITMVDLPSVTQWLLIPASMCAV